MAQCSTIPIFGSGKNVLALNKAKTEVVAWHLF